MSTKIGRNDPCWCGSGKKYKKCHEAFDAKVEILRQKGYPVLDHKLIKTPEQIEKIKESCRINVAVLDYVAEHIKAGVSTEEIDHWVHEETVRHGGIPAPLNYEGFPKSVCTSVNEVVCHGIPSEDEILKDGDIVNVDVSTIYNGYFSDSSRMFCIGNVSPEKEKLVRVTKECVEIGISKVKPWEPIGNMGHAVHMHALENGYTIVKEIGGHGVGLEFHEDPWVSYTSEENSGVIMEPGMMFTIEPMVNMGSDEVYTDEEDDWTVRTEDGMPSAQWEVTVLVTEDGCFSVGITAPGIRICAKALWEDTAKLPEIEIKKPDTILARETITSMQAGLVFGQIGQTEYIIRRVKQESGYDNLKVVATGGLGRIIAEETDLIQEYNNSLTLEGLRIIYEKNKRNN